MRPLLIGRFPYGHPDPFRSVRYLGLAAARCSHPSGELPARSTVWLPAWLPAASHKSPLVLVLGRSSLDGSARPGTATKSATYGQLPAHLLRRAHLQPYATLARVVFSLIAPRPQSLLHDVSKHRAARDHPRHIPKLGVKSKVIGVMCMFGPQPPRHTPDELADEVRYRAREMQRDAQGAHALEPDRFERRPARSRVRLILRRILGRQDPPASA